MQWFWVKYLIPETAKSGQKCSVRPLEAILLGEGFGHVDLAQASGQKSKELYHATDQAIRTATIRSSSSLW
jgi:hypothetical protein